MTMKKRDSRGPPVPPEGGGRGIEDLIKIEWEIMEDLRDLALKAKDERLKALHYQNLSSHARTLAYLIGQCGGGIKEGQDLAKLLARINRKARKFVRDIRRGKIVTAA